MMILSMFSGLTHFLDEKSAALRDFVLSFGKDATVPTIVVLATLFVGLLLISMFANR